MGTKIYLIFIACVMLYAVVCLVKTVRHEGILNLSTLIWFLVLIALGIAFWGIATLIV
ncbi:hypothetical protein ACLJJ6_00170 [Pediococcus siamensis]|uniref:hypothetical protein n=1 Tax=Pediococcus siamensis TaxID=381829 RepID=UPI0039A330A2